MKGILGRKVGMTQVFTKDGKLIPVTVVSVEPNTVMQVKTVEKDGYSAIRNIDREYTIGEVLKADTFEVGEVVDVTGTSKGKGFQGTIKRWGQSRGPMGHGSHYHRGPGSLGTMLPKRVLKGKRLPGHMGSETITIQNLEIIEVNASENYILVSGNIPGAKNSLVFIKSAIKNTKKADPKEVLTYTEETVVDEVVETPAETVVEETVETTPVEETVETPVEEEKTEETKEETANEENTEEESN